MPGAVGEARAFTAAYAGREPEPRPAAYTPRRTTPDPGLAAFFPAPPAPVPAVAAISPAMPHIATTTLPESTVRDEYRHSGQWRADAPAAITGAR
jgi:hypothetical protein